MTSHLPDPPVPPQNSDAQKNKWISAAAYILFFLPLIAAKDSKFAMYHANQGLALLLTSLGVNLILGLIPLVGWLLLPIANLALLILILMGILNALSGLVRPLPLIGSIQLL